MSDIKRINVNSNKATINPDYDAKLNHTDASLFTADSLYGLAGYNPANGINMQNAVDVLAKKHSKLEYKAAYVTESDSESDLDIGDSEGNILISLSDGHLQTLNFDSSIMTDRVNILEEQTNTYPYIDTSDSDSDLDISDENKNVLARFSEGHFKVKRFDTRKASIQVLDDSDTDLNIGDENGNVIVQFSEGHIKTKNFDSRDSESGGGSGEGTGFSHQLDGLKVLIVGDSITYGLGLSDPTSQRWGKKLADKYNWNCTINAAGGLPMATNSSNRDSIVTRLESSLTTMLSAPPDLIIIWGGHNDSGYRATPYGDFTEADKTTFCGSFRYALEKCHQYAKYAKIFLITLIHGGNYNPYSAMQLSPEKTRKDMDDAIRESARIFGAEIIECGCTGINEVSGDSGDMTADNVHPNLKGTKQLVNYFSRQLELKYVKYENI